MRPHETAALLERLEAQGRWSPEQITQKLAAADKDMEWIHAQQEQNRFDKVVLTLELGARSTSNEIICTTLFACLDKEELLSIYCFLFNCLCIMFNRK